MKIKTIEIHNYKAFYGNKNVVEIDGKNMFIYGENGSGKSSLYYALKDFFMSSMKTIDLSEVENIFIEPSNKGKVVVKLTFNPDENDNSNNQIIELPVNASSYTSTIQTIIRDTYQMHSFLSYKHLLTIHNIKNNEVINLFDLLVKGVLHHFKILGMTKTFGEIWLDIEKELTIKRTIRHNVNMKKRILLPKIDEFNKYFKMLFEKPTNQNPNPNYIVDITNSKLKYFDNDITISLTYDPCILSNNADSISGGKVNIDVEYCRKEIKKPHLFLNEARLSAIAIAIYMSTINLIGQEKKMKILFLDDLFIGLDISNRMPLMEMLEKEFFDYQIIISTYDKPWYEVIKFYLDKNSNWINWKCVELLARKNKEGYYQPLIRYDSDKKNGDHIKRFIDIAEEYYNNGDNKAAGVYLRGAFEFILKRYCFDKIKIKFNPDISKIDTEDFWTAIKEYQNSQPQKCKLTQKTISDIETYRKFVLNPLCHQDQTKYESSSEIQKTIVLIRELDKELK